MHPLDLNLASRPFKNDTLPFVAVGTAIVLLLVLTVWNIRTYQVHTAWTEDLRQVYSKTRSELEQFERRERGAQREIEGFDVETLTVRSDKANEVIGWKAFSWTQLFNLLQDVLPDDAQMVSIRPVFRPQKPGGKRSRTRDKRSELIPVSVEGAAKNIEAFFALERALQLHPHFDRVDPEGTTETRGGGPVAFQLNFLYDPSPDPVPAAESDAPPAEVDVAQAGEAPVEPVEPVEQTEAGPVTEDSGGYAEPSAPAADVPAPAEDADAEAVSATETGEAVELKAPPQDETPAVDPDAAATEQKPGPKPPGSRKGKRRGSGRGTEGTR